MSIESADSSSVMYNISESNDAFFITSDSSEQELRFA